MAHEVELLKKIAGRDTLALSELYDAYSTPIFSLATRILRDPQEAEGVLQQVFLSVWDKADQYRSEKGKVSTWLFTIARNLAIDALRKKSRTREWVPDHDLDQVADRSEGKNPLSEYIQDERRRLILEALKDIPQDQRTAVYLAYYDGLSHRQIAQTLDQPLGTVKTRIQLGLYKLRQALEPYSV